jgi:hypothetical protein
MFTELDQIGLRFMNSWFDNINTILSRRIPLLVVGFMWKSKKITISKFTINSSSIQIQNKEFTDSSHKISHIYRTSKVTLTLVSQIIILSHHILMKKKGCPISKWRKEIPCILFARVGGGAHTTSTKSKVYVSRARSSMKLNVKISSGDKC